MHSQKIVCLGEIMLRLTPAFPHERLEGTELLRMGFAGAESNIAIALAHWNNDVEFLSLLPDNAVGQAAVNLLRKHGVSTRWVKREGKRTGTYFIEGGASIRPSQVIYDREGAAITELQPDSYNWDDVFAAASYFVITGITPALSDSCAAASLQAVKMAKAAGTKVAFDFNYRSKLWSREKAREVLAAFLPYIAILFCNEGAALDILGIDGSEQRTALSHNDYYRWLAEAIQSTGDYEHIALTHREQLSASQNNWSGVLYRQQQLFFSRTYDLQIIDRFGGGDAFAAGLLHGLIRGWGDQQTIEYAIAASALKHTIPGDLNLVSEAEVLHVLNTDSSGRVLR